MRWCLLKKKENYLYLSKLIKRKIIAFFLRLVSPGFSSCSNCGTPWNHTDEKTIWFADWDKDTKQSKYNVGYFLTCNWCWERMKLDDIIKLYLSYECLKGVPSDIITRCVTMEYHKINRSQYEREEKIKKIIGE